MAQDAIGLELEAFDDIAAVRRPGEAALRGEAMPVRGDFRPALHRGIDALIADLVTMAELVEGALATCAAALRGEAADCAAVISGDAEVNGIHHRVRHGVLGILTTQAPLARDLRGVVTALLVDEELERVGDHCVSIAKQCAHLGGAPAATRTALAEMAETCGRQLADIGACMAARDAVEARAVAARDDAVDRAYHAIIDRLLEGGDGGSAGPAVVLVAHHLERIGDRVTNVAEHMIFAVDGTLVELD